MPANIDSMIYRGEMPWHRQGKRIDEPVNNIDEILELAQLDWTVSKEPTYYTRHDTRTVHQTNHFCTVRDDTNIPLGNVSERYTILQNRDAFAPFEPLLDMGYEVETAGATQEGRRVWMLAKAPEQFRVYDDAINMYLLLFTSHDGSAGSCMRPTGVRVVCDNTIDIAISRATSYNYQIKHTASIKERLTSLKDNIQIARGSFKKAMDDMERLADTKINPNELDLYFETVIPFLKDRNKKSVPELGIFTRNTAKPVYEKLMDNFLNGRGNNGESIYDAYNAITEYYTHDKKYTDWVKQTQFGQVYNYKVKALEVAKKMATTLNSNDLDLGSVVYN